MPFSPELLRLAEEAAKRSAERNAELEAMTPEEREKAIEKWARELAKDAEKDQSLVGWALDYVAANNRGSEHKFQITMGGRTLMLIRCP